MYNGEADHPGESTEVDDLDLYGYPLDDVPVIGAISKGIRVGVRALSGLTKEIKTRPTKGADGGISEHILERDASGEVISKTHRVTTDGTVVHQHQEHVGKTGAQRSFPDEWVEYPRINAD